MKENDGDAGKVPIKCIKSKMAQIQIEIFKYNNKSGQLHNSRNTTRS